ncbi:hypothetical protein UA08_05176 [Talaromyces atroroseus]|uniref:Uncharacterized protein n=1 Tax=Talaromyces atroroseus TaxID=1441469 RepID=A0A225AVE2_TALAT|nr:hypothetical protein UA08_05176 [Talaromyces atroroseus]OKL59569.1 hypothetical protein UA08_05176 [Talaromyces atroroseus]
MSLDTDVLILGAGMSGLNFAIRLQQEYPRASYTIVESSSDLGGTWSVNQYPGCGCDVASHFYSYSFALKPDWTEKYALQPEILDYFRNVATQYDVVRHIEFNSSVQKAAWDETYEIWVADVLDKKTGATRKGALFHSARWDHEFDWGNKEIVVIGNGCSATQFVPILSSGSTPKNYSSVRNPARRVTQFARQPHWIAERPNPEYTPLFKWTMRYVPLAMRLYRFWLYADMEKDFFGFKLLSGGKVRKSLTDERIEYMKRTAPLKYHATLTPATEIGCKRKVNDTGYFSCLHNQNMELVWDDPISTITETGVKTKSGREVYADAIILANGFQTQKVLYPLDSEIRGEGGMSLEEHWNEVSNGHPQAYYGTCISSFPNFFVMMGPNTTTGHLSVIYSTECQVNFSLRVLKPILQRPSLLSLSLSPKPTSVAVTLAAERNDNDWIQDLSKSLVWASGCTSWYIDSKTGRNTMLYPDWQFNYWLRSIFVPTKRDFVYKRSLKDATPSPCHDQVSRRTGTNQALRVATVIGVLSLSANLLLRGGITVGELDDLSKRVANEIRGISTEAIKYRPLK